MIKNFNNPFNGVSGIPAAYTVEKLMPEQSGTNQRGTWHSRDVIVVSSTDNTERPERLLLHLTGERAVEAGNLKVGDIIHPNYRLDVRTYTGKDGVERAVQEVICWRFVKHDDLNPNLKSLPK